MFLATIIRENSVPEIPAQTWAIIVPDSCRFHVARIDQRYLDKILIEKIGGTHSILNL